MPGPTKSTRLIRTAATDLLADGEAVEVGLRVMLKQVAYNSGVASARSVSGALGSFAADRANERIRNEQDRAEATGLPTAPRMGYGLTDRRILVWTLDTWSNKPDAFIGSIALTDLASVTFQKGLLFGRLTLTRRAGHDLTLDVARVEKGRAFADALSARLG